MSMSDPIADMITRIRNASRVKKARVAVPFSQIKETIAGILKQEGFVSDVQVEGELITKRLVVGLKYGPNGEDVIHHIQRVSKPGRRIYRKRKEVKRVLSGLGVGILSTSKGLMTDKQCRRENVGGEYLVEVW